MSYSLITAALNKLGFDQAQRLVFNLIHMGVDASMSAAAGGSLSLPSSLFALCFANPFEVSGWNYGATLANSFTCDPGAWGFIWTSSAGLLGADLLYNGASAAVLTFGEPYAGNIPHPQELFITATHYQLPLMLAHFLAHGTGMASTVCGDPLYTPYSSTITRAPKPWFAPHAHP